MTNFNLFGQIKNQHLVWIKTELGRAKANLVPRPCRLYNEKQPRYTGPPGAIVKASSNKAISLIVNAFTRENFKAVEDRILRDVYVANRIVLTWRLENGEVFCEALVFKRVHNSRTMHLTETIGILPPAGPACIILPRSDFILSAAEDDTVVLDLIPLSNECRAVVDREGAHRGFRAAGVVDTPPEPKELKPPTTDAEFQTAMRNLIQILGLDQLYTGPMLEEFARKAAKNIDRALNDLGLPRSETLNLTKANLFRTIIFCDDSGSMSNGGLFHQTLKETVKRLVPLATRLNEDSVSLRFINFNGDSKMDQVRENKIDEILDGIKPFGGTMIGAALDRKVVQPLLDILKDGNALKPLLVSIITDGEANDPSDFEAAIRRCKEELIRTKMLNYRSLGHAAVIFQIHYIGVDPSAQAFIERLDKSLGEFLFCNKQRLDTDVLDPKLTDGERNRKLLSVTTAAIDRMLEERRRNAAETSKTDRTIGQ